MLEGEIEMDNAYIGGKKEGKSGRGSENKTPFIAVVEKRENRPQRIHLRCVARYLAEFEYRFNRCSKMADMIERLAYVSLRSPSKNI
ncbi:MAG: transposase [bacterium]|nr:transposase [bacterium]